MEQVKVMHEASQIAYNASSALRTNVQVSKLPIELLNVSLYLINQWVFLHLEPKKSLICTFRISGGTFSAPTGCSPRDHGRLLAVD